MKNEDIKEQSESKVKEASKADIQISDVIAWTTTHKMFISLSVFICLVLGFLYAGRSQQIFQRESSVMIRSDSYGNSQIGELAAFSDLNLFNTGIDVYNEIEAFRSPILMERIVERLGINTTYTSKNWIGRVTDWYDETPLVVKFVEPISKYDGEAVTSFSFALSSDDDKNFLVGDIKINGKPCRSTAEVAVGVAAKTPVGTIVVSPTKFYKDNFSGTLYVDHTTVKNCAKAKIKSLESSLSDKKSTVINFSFTDSNAKRADVCTASAHASTFGGNPVASAAALAVISVIEEEKLLARATEIGSMLREALQVFVDKYEKVLEVRGKGLMLGLVVDADPREVVEAMAAQGVLALTAGKNVVRFLPPLVLKEDTLEEAVDMMSDALDCVFGE